MAKSEMKITVHITPKDIAKEVMELLENFTQDFGERKKHEFFKEFSSEMQSRLGDFTDDTSISG